MSKTSKPLSELIFKSIESRNFKWIKVKRYKMDESKSWEERYQDLDKHHIEETTFLISVIQQMADPYYWCDGFAENGYCGHLDMMHSANGCAECKCRGFTPSK